MHQRLTDTSVSRQKTQHGGHIGPDHAGTLADAGNADLRVTDHHLRAIRLGDGVRGHDAFGSAQPIVFACIGQSGIKTGFDAVYRKDFHDDASRKWQHLVRGHIELCSERHAGEQGAGTALFTGAGIGIASVDEHCPNAACAGNVLAADLHGCGTKAVLGKYP